MSPCSGNRRIESWKRGISRVILSLILGTRYRIPERALVSRRAVFFLILMLSLSVIPLILAQYGEENTSLGQFVDEFDSLNNVSLRSSIERNTTLNAMELNLTGSAAVFEDFTTFTEVDEDGDVTVIALNIAFDTMRRDAETYVWKDYGAGFFGDFTARFQVNITDLEAGDITAATVGGFAMFSNDTGVGDDLTNFLGVTISQNQATDDQFRLRLWERFGGATVFISPQQNIHSVNDPLFCTVNRTGADVMFRVYSDSTRTTLIQTTTQTGNGDRYQYNEGLMNWGRNVDPADHMTGYVDRLSFSEPGGYQSPGHFSTTDYLDYVNGSTLVQLTNATIPAGTSITVRFSLDNATWINPTALTAGFMSIDLRELNWSGSYYLNYSFTGNLGATPRLYQSRLITTVGTAGPGTPGLNVSRETVTYNLTEIGVTLGTLDAGNLASTFDIDGDMFNVSELAGVPGMTVSGNFSGVSSEASCLWVVIYAHYDGNLNHDFDIELWNFTGSAWVEDSHITDGVELTWFNSTLYALRVPTEFLSGGEVRVRLDHESPGNINHDLFIEYFKLLAELPAGPTPGAGIVNIIESDFPWIAIAIILMCVAYLLFRALNE